jgi:O-antigen/teichoic acid export membrane protein
VIQQLKPKSEFSRNVLTLITGTTIAQAIPIAISPILTRLYSPEDFGVLALFIAITMILGSVANARYEMAVIVSRTDDDAINIAALSVIISTVFSIILLFLVVLLNGQLTRLLGNEEIEFWLYLAPVVVWLTGFFNVLNYLNIRKIQYMDIAKTSVYKNLVMAIFQISIGVVKAGASGLIVGQVMSNISANYRLSKNVIRHYCLSEIRLKKSYALGKKYKDYPLHNMPATLVDSAALQMPFLLLPKLFSLTVGGQFFLAQRMVGLPSTLISKPISQVFFQTMTEKNNNGEKTLPFLKSTLKRLFLIALPITITIYIVSPFLFRIIFGEEWAFSGTIAQYIVIAFFIRFIVSTVSPVFSISGHLKIGAAWKYLYFVSSLIIFSYGFLSSTSFEDFLIIFVFHEYVLYMFYLYLIFKVTKKMDRVVK